MKNVIKNITTPPNKKNKTAVVKGVPAFDVRATTIAAWMANRSVAVIAAQARAVTSFFMTSASILIKLRKTIVAESTRFLPQCSNFYMGREQIVLLKYVNLKNPLDI